MSVKSIAHKFVSGVADGADATVVRPSNWNDDHNFYLGIEAQTGTSYTFADNDDWCLVTFSNASPVAAALPQAGAAGAFLEGWVSFVRNKGAGAVTITPATSTIDGGASFVLASGQSIILISDGTNYTTMPMASPASIALTGTPTAPTAADSTNTTQIATTAFVRNLVAAGLATFIAAVGSVSAASFSFLGRTGDGMYSPASAALGLTTGGTERARITSTVFTVGVAGTTNPAFQVDYSAGSAATGIKIAAAAAASGVAISVTSSGTNENLTIDAKGSGPLTLQGTATGAITLARATTISAALTYGGVTLSNAVTGTGNMVLSVSPTLTGTLTAAVANFSGKVTGLSLDLIGVTATAAKLVGYQDTSNEIVIEAVDASNGATKRDLYLQKYGGTVHINGVTTIVNATASTTAANGALVVTGGVGIGGALWVGGSINASGATIAAAGAQLTINATSGSATLQFREAGTPKWTMSSASGTLTLLDEDFGQGVQIVQNATAWSGPSDERMKNIIGKVTVLDKLKHWQLYDIEWKRGGKRDVSPLAQQVYRGFPYMVGRKGDDDPTYVPKSLKDPRAWTLMKEYAGLTAMQGLKELHHVVTDHGVRIAALEQRLAA
jgi:hypothetical protein